MLNWGIALIAPTHWRLPDHDDRRELARLMAVKVAGGFAFALSIGPP